MDGSATKRESQTFVWITEAKRSMTKAKTAHRKQLLYRLTLQ